MADYGMRVHGDGNDDEVRSEPRIGGISREERHDQVTGDCTATANRKSNDQILELEPR
jgi:hypothetical protein